MALRNSNQRFDVIIGDAFTDIAAPEHMVTLEFFDLVSDRLASGGVFAMNFIDNVDRLDALAAVSCDIAQGFQKRRGLDRSKSSRAGERRVFVLLAGAKDSPVSAIETAAPDMTRFQALAPASWTTFFGSGKPGS